MSRILSRVDRSESRDEIISSVQSQKQVATRSTAAIASHERPSTSSTFTAPVFAGANFDL